MVPPSYEVVELDYTTRMAEQTARVASCEHLTGLMSKSKWRVLALSHATAFALHTPIISQNAKPHI